MRWQSGNSEGRLDNQRFHCVRQGYDSTVDIPVLISRFVRELPDGFLKFFMVVVAGGSLGFGLQRLKVIPDDVGVTRAIDKRGSVFRRDHFTCAPKLTKYRCL